MQLENKTTAYLLKHFRQLQWERGIYVRRLADCDPDSSFDKGEVKRLDVEIAQVKSVLDTRPHVPNKIEAKAIRQAKAKQKANR